MAVIERDQKADEIVQQYEDTLDRIGELSETLEWWHETLQATPMDQLIKRMQAEIDSTKLEWERILPKDFALSQARVKALSRVLDELRNAGEKTEAEIRSKRSLKNQIESSYPLILKGAGYNFDPVKAEEEAQPEEGNEDADEAPDDDEAAE